MRFDERVARRASSTAGFGKVDSAGAGAKKILPHFLICFPLCFNRILRSNTNSFSKQNTMNFVRMRGHMKRHARMYDTKQSSL